MEAASIGAFWANPAVGEPYQTVSVEDISPALGEALDSGIAFVCEGCSKFSGQRMIHYAHDNPHGGTS